METGNMDNYLRILIMKGGYVLRWVRIKHVSVLFEMGIMDIQIP